MDSNKTAGEEARRQLHKNAGSNLEQVLVATPSRHQMYGHMPPITKTIQVRRTRHAGHCWRSRDELISDVVLWTPTHGWARAGQPARTYIQQLCEDTGCSPEDLPEAMNDREKWRERVRDIRASRTTSWWWWYIYIYIYIYICVYLYTHTHTHTHTSIYIYLFVSLNIFWICVRKILRYCCVIHVWLCVMIYIGKHLRVCGTLPVCNIIAEGFRFIYRALRFS